MSETIGQAAGITIELDVEQLCARLGQQVSKQIATELAELFPREAGEFWAALCDQAYRERRRVASMLDLTCPHQDQCPHKPDVLTGLRFEGKPEDGQAAAADLPPSASRPRGGARQNKH